MDKPVERVQTNVSEPQMALAVIEAWKSMFGNPPSKEQVSMVLAQNSLETGARKSMWNYNVGNITHVKGDGFDYQVSPDWHYETSKDESGNTVRKKVTHQAQFRAYPNLNSGVKDYLHFLSGSKRYADAWQHMLHPDPVAYSKALKAAGYYGADESVYTAGVKRLFNDANKSNSYDLAMSGKVQPPAGSIPATTRPTAPPSEVASLDQILENFVHMLSAAASDPTMKRLYKKALPNQDILIKIAAPDYTSAVEFSRVLCSVLDEDLLSTSYTYTDGQEVEVECSIPGPATECLATVQQMTQAVVETFQDATAKIGGISIKAECIINKKSSYQPISLRTAGANYRKFLLKFV